MGTSPNRLESVCVFCGSSDAADPSYLADAGKLGAALARARIKLVYGGGGVGLMGACARAAHTAGGEVLGVIPDFLTARERAYDDVETVVVTSMHERKQLMFEAADAFAVLPGGIGTLEEVVELLSWRRLELHTKPVVFHNPQGFWRPLFDLFQHTIDQRLSPPSFAAAWSAVDRIEDVIPALRLGLSAEPDAEPAAMRVT
jgi:uncharacterized protein (TIGR00730 family)